MSKIKTIFGKLWGNYITQYMLLAILVNLFIETLARFSTSPVAGLQFMVHHPFVFLYNALIIFAFMSLSLLFRHRRFFLFLFGGVWVVLGVVNGIILANRMTPFTTNDLMELKDGLSLVSTYMSGFQVILLVAAAISLVLLIVFMFLKLKKSPDPVKYKKVVPEILLVLIIAAGATFGCVKVGILDTYFPNLNYGYRDNGFSYCFMATGFDKGVKRPSGYSKKYIDNIFTKEQMDTTVAGKETSTSSDTPNIIFLQLESFIDPSFVKDVKLSEDPIPYFRKLMKNYSTGKLTVPAVGAGTANTEFETMTGMSVHFFGPGEYPYKSVLLDESCESIPYDLQKIGYSTHAIHNHRAVFYERNKALANLGFQTFTSIEYMNNISKTPKGWARDYVLTDNIEDALNSTKGPDYIYTISVQGHGKYPTEKIIDDPVIKCTSAPTEELKWSWEYYANQIHEMDQFVQQLLTKLSKSDEHTIVVMYGDHLPALDNLTKDNLKGNRSVFQTNYVIWDNYNFEKRKVEDLKAYQIGSELLNRIGIHNGTMVTYQQNYRNSKTYSKDMKMLQYDMLYGNKYIYGGTSPFSKEDMQMGVKKIKIDKVVKIGEKYYIKGQNFTEYSKITIGDKVLDTTYIGPTILGLNEEVKSSDVKKMKVSQTDSKGATILSTTE